MSDLDKAVKEYLRVIPDSATIEAKERLAVYLTHKYKVGYEEFKFELDMKELCPYSDHEECESCQ